MKAKRLLAPLLAFVFLVGGMAACSSAAEKDSLPVATMAVAQATEAAGQATEAAAQATEAAAAKRAMTQVAQTTGALPADTPAGGLSPPVTAIPSPVPATATRSPAPTSPPPPMPSPEICVEESESFWHWQAGYVAINDVFFTTSSVGFAVGEPNTLLRTDDGGSGWRAWPIDLPHYARSIYFSSPETGWIAGDEGMILRTIDGGLSWEPQNSGTEEWLRVIKFWDDKIGWAGGRKTLLHTTDGGASWSSSTLPEEIMWVVDLAFVDPQEGYLVGYEDWDGLFGRILHTTDGGATWEYTGFSGAGPAAIYAAKDMPTWVAGGWVDGTIWKGIDHTSQAVSPGGGHGKFTEVLFSDAQHGWAIGCGLAVRTEDGGEHWQSMEVPESACWTMLRFVSEEEAVLAATSLRVAHSSDGGRSWVMVPAGGSHTQPYGNVNNLDFVDPWFGWAVSGDPGRGHLLSTIDGGQSWEEREALGGAVLQVEFVDRLRGWAIGAAGLVARSDNGGRSWEIQSIPFPEDLQAVAFVDRHHGWIVSAEEASGVCPRRVSGVENLVLFRTSSAGDEWEGPICVGVPQEPSSSWRKIAPQLQFIDQDIGWLVGADGLIAKTTDGGLNWQIQASGVSVDLTDVHFLDSQIGWVTGDEGVLLQTTDGGEQWLRQRVGETKLTGVRFVDKDTGWVTSWHGSSDALYTSDGGQTWHPVGRAAVSYRGGQPHGLDAVDVHHVWVATAIGIRAYAPVCLSRPKP